MGVASGFHPGLGANAGPTGYRGTGLATGGVRTMPNVTTNRGVAGNGFGIVPSRVNQNYFPATRVNNAWTDPSDLRLTNARNGTYATSARRNDPIYTTRPGNHLYPGSYGYGQNPSNNYSYYGQNGGNGYRGRHRYFYNNFPYGVYAPYLYNNYGYGGYGNEGYGDVATSYAGLNTDNSIADLGAPDFSSTPNNYYSYEVPEQQAPAPNPPAPNQSLPDAPTVGPQTPAPADRSANAAQGPDSLVEAVQNELSHRGYFEGKPDSMYSAATKEAIRRFQTDQGLPATGRVNEATLHALHLD